MVVHEFGSSKINEPQVKLRKKLQTYSIDENCEELFNIDLVELVNVELWQIFSEQLVTQSLNVIFFVNDCWNANQFKICFVHIFACFGKQNVKHEGWPQVWTSEARIRGFWMIQEPLGLVAGMIEHNVTN